MKDRNFPSGLPPIFVRNFYSILSFQKGTTFVFKLTLLQNFIIVVILRDSFPPTLTVEINKQE